VEYQICDRNTTKQEVDLEQLTAASCFAGELQEKQVLPETPYGGAAGYWKELGVQLSPKRRKATTFIWYHRIMNHGCVVDMPHVDGKLAVKMS
jgi:hypothetical protein